MEESLSLINRSETVPIDLSWTNLTCTVKTSQGPKQILSSVSGYALHNEFSVIMGSSGAGKTTLLNILSGRLKASEDIEITGSISANNFKVSGFFFKKHVGYVTQEDALLETLTVFESLLFVARLKTQATEQKVQDLIKELDLTDCTNSVVGGKYIAGISGGEKRRLAIGLELITNPSVLILDEPTSGLDSFTALKVCKLLIKQAEDGKTVIATIHQPSSELFSMFHKLTLLCNGQVLFHGSALSSVNYFAEIDFVCPSFTNPADYYMDLLFIKDNKTASEDPTLKILTEKYKQTQVVPVISNVFIEITSEEYETNFFFQSLLLTHRFFLVIWRNPFLNIFRISLFMLIAVLSNIFYWDIGSTGTTSVNDRANFLFFSVSCLIFANALGCTFGFISMRTVMVKEYRTHLYGITSYFTAMNITDLIFDFLLSVIYCSLIYWTVGLNTNSADVVIVFFFISYLSLLMGGSIGMISGTVFMNPEIAISLCVVVLFSALTYSGFFRVSNTPATVSWLKYSSCVYYLYQAFMKNQFDTLHIEDCCRPISYDCDLCRPLEFYNIDLELYQSILYSLVFVTGFRLIGLLAIYRATKND